MHKTRIFTLVLILIAIVTLPAAVTFANAQTNHQTKEELVAVAQKADSQIQNLITKVYADP